MSCSDDECDSCLTVSRFLNKQLDKKKQKKQNMSLYFAQQIKNKWFSVCPVLTLFYGGFHLEMNHVAQFSSQKQLGCDISPFPIWQRWAASVHPGAKAQLCS